MLTSRPLIDLVRCGVLSWIMMASVDGRCDIGTRIGTFHSHVSFDSWASHPEDGKRVIRSGDAVYVGDTLHLGYRAESTVILSDGGYKAGFFLMENTRIGFSEFSVDKGLATGIASIRLERGMLVTQFGYMRSQPFRFVVRFETPGAMIEINEIPEMRETVNSLVILVNTQGHTYVLCRTGAAMVTSADGTRQIRISGDELVSVVNGQIHYEGADSMVRTVLKKAIRSSMIRRD